jgi:hypothetical protein
MKKDRFCHQFLMAKAVFFCFHSALINAAFSPSFGGVITAR